MQRPLIETRVGEEFVGRERELADLRGAFARVVDGAGQVVVIAGEPGIGKTRLCQELAAAVRAAGGRAVWGRCWQAAATVYEPWMQVLRSLLADADDRALLRADEAATSRLAALLPELLADGPVATTRSLIDDSEESRLAVFAAVVALLRRAARDRPLLIVLDDVHDADQASVQLLAFVARSIADGRILLLATYREPELARSPERARLVGHLARIGHRLYLGGLSEPETGRLMATLVHHEPTPAAVPVMYRSTAGNPFFVSEVVRLLAAERTLDRAVSASHIERRIPEGVRDVVRQRVQPLSASSAELLRRASVLGQEFDLACLQRLSDTPLAGTLDLLDEAQQAGLIERLGPSAERFAFHHALIRATLYDDLSGVERAEWHHRAAAAREALHASNLDPVLAEIAHHYQCSLPVGSLEKAVIFTQRAGERAATLLAYEEAAERFERAIELHGQLPHPDDRQRLGLLLALGDARTSLRATDDARAPFVEATRVARGLDDPVALARAAVGYAERGLATPAMRIDDAAVALLEEARRRLPATDSLARVQVLARLAVELCFDPDRARALALSRDSVAMAERLGDGRALAVALNARNFLLWRRNELRAVEPIVGQLIELAERAGDQSLVAQGRMWRVLDLMNRGEVDALALEMRRYGELAAALRQPRHLWLVETYRGVLALWAGRWSDAEELAQRALVLGEGLADPTAAAVPLLQLFLAHREQGLLADLSDDEAKLRFMVQQVPANPVPRALLGLLHSDLGHVAEAGAEFARLAAEEFADLQREFRIGVLPFLAELCAMAGDRARAALLYQQLQPFAEYNIIMGGGAFVGAAPHHLAVLAATMGEREQARAHFERALARHAEIRSEPWLAKSQYEYAGFLVDDGAVPRAWALLAGALATSERLGMRPLAQKVSALIATVEAQRARYPNRAAAAASGDVPAGTPSPPVRATVVPFARTRPPLTRVGAAPPLVEKARPAEREVKPLAPEVTMFRRDGDLWLLGLASANTRVAHRKGMEYLVLLLRHADREFHVTELAAGPDAGPPASAGPPTDLSAQRGLGDAGEMLDSQATAQYRARLRALREQLAEADSWNDAARAAGLRQEMDFLTDELTRAIGLSGRGRRAADHAERARVNVSRAIRSAIRHIGQHDRVLAKYLETTIKTGWFCRYTPDTRIPIVWSF